MTNRIGGDFNYEAIEAFRAAYAQQMATPDEEQIANNSGLPTNIIANTSPWLETTGLWKYPSGKGPDDDLKTPFNPDSYYSSEIVDEDDDEFDEIIDEIANQTEE
jgi:hypothetical protein